VLGILAFFMGASVGSFLNVVADRLPAGRSVVHTRSFCESCNRTLNPVDMVPVVSFLWLRGRCRHCRASIPARLVLVEALNGLLFTALYLRHGFGPEFALLGSAVSVLVVVALIDLERGLILDRIIFPSIAALLVLGPFWTEVGLSRSFLGSSSAAASLSNSVVAGAGAFLLFLGFGVAYPAGMGGGDIKLAGAVGLLVGYPGVFFAVWLAAVSGGLVAASLLVLRKKGRKDAIPFGPFLAGGAAAVLLAGGELLDWYHHIVGSL
jgi:leader peptidase (prepilin peptidase)/N-methyltransferase